MFSPTLSEMTYIVPRVGTPYQYLICNKQYKRKAAYLRHQQTIMTYNTITNDCYMLPANTTDEFRKIIVFMIKERLKLHFCSTEHVPLEEPDPLEKPDILEELNSLENSIFYKIIQ
ncbi:17529_t:CDS:2 [Funneliformis geosporum]|nr:17529_t:CDS:2 [Funneliformis geosporum]